MTNITDVFFDLDHTLWDFDKNSGFAFETIFAKHDIKVDLDLFMPIYAHVNQYYWDLYRKDLISQDELRNRRLVETFKKVGPIPEPHTIALLADAYIQHLTDTNHLIEGTLDILNYLLPKYKLHIITNGFDEVQDKKLKNAKIDHYFKTVTNSEMAGVKKPNPIIFNHAIELAKTSAQNSIMIGDCIESDVKGAIDFGMKAIHFNPTSHNVHPHIISIQSLSDLKTHL